MAENKDKYLNMLDELLEEFPELEKEAMALQSGLGSSEMGEEGDDFEMEIEGTDELEGLDMLGIDMEEEDYDEEDDEELMPPKRR